MSLGWVLKVYKSEADKLKDLTDGWYHAHKHLARTREERMRLKHAGRRNAIKYFREKGKRNEANEPSTGQGHTGSGQAYLAADRLGVFRG